MTKTAMGALLDEEGSEQEPVKAPQKPKGATKSAEDLKLPPEDEIPAPETMLPPMATPNKTERIPDYRGKRIAQKDALFASLGISRELIPPITRKRVAIYQLYNFKGKRDKRMMETIDQYVDPYPYEMVPNYTFTDIKETDLTRREKTLTYYEGGSETIYRPDPVTGKNMPHSIPKVGMPVFVNGQVTVNIYNEFRKFVWWELHPRNASNKRRDFSKEPIFERVDTKYESSHVQMIKMDLAMDAEKYILQMKEDRLMGLAAAMTNPTVNPNINPQELRLVMRMRAKANPEEILYSAPDKEASTKVSLIHALDLGIITYLPERECYYYSDDDEPVHRVLTGSNPFEDFTAFLTSAAGAPTLERIKTDLDFWF